MTIKCSLVSIYESTANVSVLALTGAKGDFAQHSLWKQQQENSDCHYILPQAYCVLFISTPTSQSFLPWLCFRLRTVGFRLSRTGDIKVVTFILVGQEI